MVRNSGIVYGKMEVHLSISLELVEMLVEKVIQISLTALLGLFDSRLASLFLHPSAEERDEQIGSDECNGPVQS